MNFESKVKSMRVHEIVDSMIKGIRNQWVRLDFDTFGVTIDNVCYGCGATNAICEINGKILPHNFYYNVTSDRAKFFNDDTNFINTFEDCIDILRLSDVERFIEGLIDMNLINEDDGHEISKYDGINDLPVLCNDSISYGILESQLMEYEHFRDWLKERNL